MFRKLIGTTQVTVQFLLWLYAIYMTNFVILPDFFKENQIKQFLLYFLCVLHQLCMCRNLYKAMFTSSRVSQITKEEIKDKENKYNICKKCSQLRPNRSHHCSICEMCVDKMDHHCYILNNCVGRKNYKYFFSYIFLTLINAGIMFTLSLLIILQWKEELKGQFKKQKFAPFPIQILFNLPVRTFLLLFIAFVTAIMMSYFVMYHLFLLYKDETTIERKHKQLKYQSQKNKSFKDKINKMIESDNWLDIYWPD